MSGSSPSAGGQAPESGQPQVGTPAPAATNAPGAQPFAPQVGVGQPSQPKYAFQSDAEMETFIDRQIAARQRANHKEQEAKGELSDLRQQVQYLVVQQQMDRQRAIAANVQLQAKTLGFRNPAFVYGAIASQLQYDQASGQPSNAQTLLEALKASDPYLLETPPQPGTPQPPSQPGQQPQGQPGMPGQPVPTPQVPGQPLPQQTPTGVMNAPQSATNPPGGGLTWEIVHANIHNHAWVAANEQLLEAFMADPLNHQRRQR